MNDSILLIFFLTFIVIAIFAIVVCYAIWLHLKDKDDPALPGIANSINSFYAEVEKARSEYIVKTKAQKLYDIFTKLNSQVSSTHVSKHSPYLQLVNQFKKDFANFSAFIIRVNKEYVESEILKNKKLFDNIDGKSLDSQQRIAVVTDEMNNLVLAGAGSGKTLTIAAKVKYLCQVKGINPHEVLLISFTKKSSEEMTTRISEKLRIPIKAVTFHKLGLDIIFNASHRRPDILDDLDKVVSNYFRKHIINDSETIALLLEFFAYYLNIPADYEDFDSLGEYHEFQKSVDFETLKSKYKDEYVIETARQLKSDKQTLAGERCKSLEEVIIANFLFLHGIEYEYEKLYPYPSEDKYRKPYRPDFYLPEYGLYLEHFGITEDDTVPWLSPIEAQKYLEDMQWKREFHKKNGTTLLETYSYYSKQGHLLEKLTELLVSHGAIFKEVDFRDIFEKLYIQQSDKYFKEFIKLVCSFITLYKSNGYTFDHIDRLLTAPLNKGNEFLRKRNKIFVMIVKPILAFYEQHLLDEKAIDFSDMINQATSYIQNGAVQLSYRYIIIDEYQDTSVGRYKLVKTILDTTGAKLMCVGDDWQSIFRFAGSDISLFTNFSDYYGYSSLLRIEKTYRNSQELISVAGDFVMKNPMQMRKTLISNKHLEKPVKIVRYDNNFINAIEYVINEIINAFGPSAEILLLGRTNYDLELLNDSNDFTVNADQTVIFNAIPTLKISFLSVHKAKGLEAENVILLNLENKLLGFPNKIADDPVLEMVLSGNESFDYAEERRLFYVAITRAKNSTYLMVPDKKPSVFVAEIEKSKSVYTILQCDHSVQNNPHCPKCKTGYLVPRNNNIAGKTFVGCSNYPQCDYTINCASVLDQPIVCPICGGFLIRRTGQYGVFFGCSNYPHCKYSMDADVLESETY